MEKAEESRLSEKKAHLREVSDFGKYGEEKLENLARLGIALDELIEAYGLDSIAIRCWDELQKKYGIAPCVLLSDLNERGIPAACELDINNAVMMRALASASARR